MILLFLKRPLNNGSKGFRYCFKVGFYFTGKTKYIINKQGKYIKRVSKSNGYKFNLGICFNRLDFGKRSLYFYRNEKSVRKVHHFAG